MPPLPSPWPERSYLVFALADEILTPRCPFLNLSNVGYFSPTLSQIAMIIELKPEDELLVQKRLASGAFATA
jgi:hypothetical protein